MVYRQPMRLFDMDHDWFRPLWVRLAIVALAAGWAAFEFSMGETVWAGIFGAIALYALWSFFLDPVARARRNAGRDDPDRRD